METPLHRFADAHDGVVTCAVAESFGFDWPAFRALTASEGWAQIGRGTYVRPGTLVGLRTRVRAEQLRRPALVASHRTAARLLGGDALTDAFEFLNEGGRYDVPRGRAHRTTWHAGDVVEVDGLLVTSPLRTAADLLRAGPRDEAVCAVDGLLRCGAVTLDAVAAYLTSLGGERYVRRAWGWFARLDPGAGSVAESLARLRLWDAGLIPRSQVALADVAGRRVRVDFWFPDGVVVEIEGFAFHSTREAHQHDVTRFNALTRLPGVTVLRFSRDDVVHRPAAMVAAVRAALRRAVSSDAAPRATGEYGSRYSPVTSGGGVRRVG